jgi:hypothetical protein
MAFVSYAASGDLRYGFELELSPARFAQLIDFYDFDRWVSRNPDVLSGGSVDWLPEYFQNYPLARGALDAMPADIRAKLEHGLTLPQSSIQTAEPATGLILSGVGAEKKPPQRTQQGLILPEEKKIPQASGIQKPLAPGHQVLDSGLLVREGMDTSRNGWPTLLERWERLTLAEKIRAHRPQLVDPGKKARLLMEKFKWKTSIGDALPVLPSAPAWLKGLEVKFDGTGTIELSPLEGKKLRSIDALMQIFDPLTERVGAKKAFENPRLGQRGFNFHWHFSKEGVDLTRVAEEYKKLVLMKVWEMTLGLSEVDAKKVRGDFKKAFQIGTDSKGIIRRVDESHIEGCDHFESIRNELSRMTKLADLSTEEAVARLQAERLQVLKRNPALSDLLVEEAPEIFRHFSLDIRKNPETLRRARIAVVESEAAKNPGGGLGQKQVRLLFEGVSTRELLTSGDPARQLLGVTVLKFQGFSSAYKDPKLVLTVLERGSLEAKAELLRHLPSALLQNFQILEQVLKSDQKESKYALLRADEQLRSVSRRNPRLAQMIDKKVPDYLRKLIVDLNNSDHVRQVRAMIAEGNLDWIDDLFWKQPVQFARLFPENISDLRAFGETTLDTGAVKPFGDPFFDGAYRKIISGKPTSKLESDLFWRLTRIRKTYWQSHLALLGHTHQSVIKNHPRLTREYLKATQHFYSVDSWDYRNSLWETLEKDDVFRSQVISEMRAALDVELMEKFPFDLRRQGDVQTLRKMVAIGGNSLERQATSAFFERIADEDPELLRTALPEIASRYDLSPFPRCEYHKGGIDRTIPTWSVNGNREKLVQNARNFSSIPEAHQIELRELIEIPLSDRPSRQAGFYAYLLDQDSIVREMALERLRSLRPGDSPRFATFVREAADGNSSVQGILTQIRAEVAPCVIRNLASPLRTGI